MYRNGDKILSLQPLKGQIDPTKSDYTVGKVKVEIRLAKMVLGRWGGLVGDVPDRTSFSTLVMHDSALAFLSACTFRCAAVIRNSDQSQEEELGRYHYRYPRQREGEDDGGRSQYWWGQYCQCLFPEDLCRCRRRYEACDDEEFPGEWWNDTEHKLGGGPERKSRSKASAGE